MEPGKEADEHDIGRAAGKEPPGQPVRENAAGIARVKQGLSTLPPPERKEKQVPQKPEKAHPEPGHNDRKKDPVDPEKRAGHKQDQRTPGPEVLYKGPGRLQQKKDREKLRHHGGGSPVGHLLREEAVLPQKP